MKLEKKTAQKPAGLRSMKVMPKMKYRKAC